MWFGRDEGDKVLESNRRVVTHRLLAEGLAVLLAHLPAHGQRDGLHLLAQARRLDGVRTLSFFRGLLKRSSHNR